MSETKRYQWKGCQLTAQGIILTCAAHDDAAVQPLVLRRQKNRQLPCEEAKEVWYQELTFLSNRDAGYNGYERLSSDGQKALIEREQNLLPLTNQEFQAIAPFAEVQALLHRLSDQQMRHLLTNSPRDMREGLAESIYLPPQWQSLLLQDPDESVLWATVLREDLLPELQPALATRKEPALRQGLANRSDLLPELQWVLAESGEYHVLNQLRAREDLLPGVMERADAQYKAIELAGGDGIVDL